jgi:hypothetical protein
MPPRTLAREVPLASNAQPVPEIFALLAAAVAHEGVVAAAVAVVEVDVDDGKIQQSRKLCGQLWYAWKAYGITPCAVLC